MNDTGAAEERIEVEIPYLHLNTFNNECPLGLGSSSSYSLFVCHHLKLYDPFVSLIVPLSLWDVIGSVRCHNDHVYHRQLPYEASGKENTTM